MRNKAPHISMAAPFVPVELHSLRRSLKFSVVFFVPLADTRLLSQSGTKTRGTQRTVRDQTGTEKACASAPSRVEPAPSTAVCQSAEETPVRAEKLVPRLKCACFSTCWAHLGSFTFAVEGLTISKGATAAKATRTKKKLVSHCSCVFDKEGLADSEMCPFEASSHQLFSDTK